MKISHQAFITKPDSGKQSSFSGLLDAAQALKSYLADPSSFVMRRDFRDGDCFISEHNDLGSYVRWALLLEVLWERWQGDPVRLRAGKAERDRTIFFIAWLYERAEDYLHEVSQRRRPPLEAPRDQDNGSAGRKLRGTPGDGVHQSNATKFLKFFAHRPATPRPSSRYQVEDPVFSALLSKLKTLFPHRRSDLLQADVLGIRAMGARHAASAPDRFKAWLRTGILPPDDDLTLLRAEYLIPDKRGARQRQLRDIVREIQAGPENRPFLNVHAESAGTGLTAFATSLLVQLREVRANASSPLPHGLIYVNLARRHNGVEAPTRESVLQAFENAFKISDRRGTRTVHRPIDLYADLLAVRQALTVHPTVVVIDGLINDGSALSPVLSLLRNTQWDEFFRVLAMPVGIGSTLAEVHQSRSRFVILSSLPVSGLSAWTAYCGRLEPLNDLKAVGSLLERPGPFVDRLRKQCEMLEVQVHDHSELATRYTLKEPYTAYFDIGRSRLLPAECDLALASLLEKGDMAVLQAQQPMDGMRLGGRRRVVFNYWLEREIRRNPLAVLALKLIAACLNGLRRATLHRSLLCLHQLVAQSPADRTNNLNIPGLADYVALPGPQQIAMLSNLASQYPSILVNGPDEVIEVIDVKHRWAEVQIDPMPLLIDGADDKLHLDLVHEEIRALLVGAMTGPPCSSGISCHGEWEHINLVLAEEALRQATSQLRHLHQRDLPNLSAHRRIVQAILHGLMSCRLDDPQHPNQPVAERLPSFALPAEPSRRLRFLYVFLYRHGLEDAPQWLLARAFGRPDLKLSLLMMFADPAGLRTLLTRAADSQSTPSNDGNDAVTSFNRGSSVAMTWPWMVDSPAMRSDLLRAIGRAAYEVGAFDLVDLVIRSSPDSLATDVPPRTRTAVDEGDPFARSLRRIAEEVEALRSLRSPSSVENESNVGFPKLHIDMLQVKGETAKARDECTSQLNRLGFSHPDLQRLGVKVMGTAARRWHVGDKAVLEESANRIATAWLSQSAPAKSRLAASDMLFRLGEILATEADKHKRDDQGFRAFLNAYAVYWIADRMRTGGSGVDDGLNWPLISSRPLRYFVRVTLKIAQFVATHPAAGQDTRSEAFAFLGAAKVRIDVHARHMHRLPRERVGMLLLMSSFARVGWEVEQAFASSSDGGMLMMSLDYVHEAERLAIEMGFPAPVAYRLLLERAKTYRRIAEANQANALTAFPSSRLCCDQADRDLNTLSSLSQGSGFWTALVARLKESVAATRRKTQRSSLSMR